MFNFSETEIAFLIVHAVGNKGRDEGVQLSTQPQELTEDNAGVFMTYFLRQFKNIHGFHSFFHEQDVNNNLTFKIIKHCFDDEKSIAGESRNLARNLYEVSEHPFIASGEF